MKYWQKVLIPPAILIVLAGCVLAWWGYRHAGYGKLSAAAEKIEIEELLTADVAAVDDLVLHCYGYRRNEFRDFPSLREESFVTGRDGKLPAFRFEGVTYVVLDKWVNFSAGLAAGKGDPPRENVQFSFEPLREGLWVWTLDLEK